MPARRSPAAVLIAGPTASGKSGLALAIADRVGGVVINADSMQVYREIPILTAQPSRADQARVAHRLYGHVSATEAYSVGRYVEDVRAVLAVLRRDGRCPVVVGGTGMYLKALLEGLSPVSPVPADVRAAFRARAGEGLWPLLQERDPTMAARLAPTDTQRILRALEVVTATGRSLAEWQSMPGAPVFDALSTIRLTVWRERADLQARCDARFDAMLAEGALTEVAALSALALPRDRPALKALGVAPLMAHLSGDLTIEAAAAEAKADTRRYVKRQQTWLRKFMAGWTAVSGDDADDPVRTAARLFA